MTTGPTHPRRPRWRSIGAAAGLACAVLATVVATGAAPSGASPTTDEPATTTTTAEAAATTTVEGSSTEEFTATLDAACEGGSGHPLLAAALQSAAAPDGSLRVVTILERCDVEFSGAVDAELGRPNTNVEELIADPVNNVTPNQAQLDLLNAELAIYWRIADAWVQAQAAGTPPAAPDTAPIDTAEAPATTGG